MSADSSIVLAVRVPIALARQVHADAGADRGPLLAEHLRNRLRQSVGVSIDFAAGYEEGKMQGWADANESFRKALKGARA